SRLRCWHLTFDLRKGDLRKGERCERPCVVTARRPYVGSQLPSLHRLVEQLPGDAAVLAVGQSAQSFCQSPVEHRHGWPQPARLLEIITSHRVVSQRLEPLDSLVIGVRGLVATPQALKQAGTINQRPSLGVLAAAGDPSPQCGINRVEGLFHVFDGGIWIRRLERLLGTGQFYGKPPVKVAWYRRVQAGKGLKV